MQRIKISYQEFLAARNFANSLLKDIKQEIKKTRRSYAFCFAREKTQELINYLNELRDIEDEILFYLKEINSAYLAQVQLINKGQIDVNYPIL